MPSMIYEEEKVSVSDKPQIQRSPLGFENFLKPEEIERRLNEISDSVKSVKE